MTLEETLKFVPTYLLVVFRLAGAIVFAPLLGSARIPRRVKILMTLVMAAGMCGAVRTPVTLPDSTWQLTLAIAGEIVFGIAMGLVMSFTFIATQWAGEMIGQQMGFNISEVLDPQFGGAGSLIGDLYFMLTLVVFLSIGGHREMLRGIQSSFVALPLMSVGMDQSLLDTIVGLFQACTSLAVRLAAPMLVTMLVVDLALGCIGKAMPQMNVMTAGLTVRSLLGIVVLLVGLKLSIDVIGNELDNGMNSAVIRWSTPAAPAGAAAAATNAP